MNYYIIVPSAVSFCHRLDSTYTHSVFLVCAPCVSCLIVSFLSLRADTKNYQKTTFYTHLALSALFPLLGNVIYTIAYERRDLWCGVIGRFIIGLFSSDVINKQSLVENSGINTIASEMVVLRKTQLISIFLGLLVGAMLDFEEKHIDMYHHVFTISFETLPAYVMFVLWTLQLLALILLPMPRTDREDIKWSTNNYVDLTTSLSDQDEGQSEHVKTIESHSRSNSDQAKLEYYMKKLNRDISESSNILELKTHQEDVQASTKNHLIKSRKDVWTRTFKLLMHNFALPVSIVIYIFCNMTIEIIMLSCVIITNQYFDWSGSSAGYFLSILVTTYIPLYFVASLLIRQCCERSVLKRGFVLVFVALVIEINYQSLYTVLSDIYHQLLEYYSEEPAMKVTRDNDLHYNWQAGVYQYCIGISMAFVSSVLIEGASLSLMSKKFSDKLKTSSIICSSLVPLFGCIGKIFGGAILIIIGFSSNHIDTDIVNLISFCLLIISSLCYYLLKTHYFFLYGDPM